MDRGLDVSRYNAISNAAAVRAAGYSFAWCKASQGTSSVDATFAGKVAQLTAAGIVVGAYHYLDDSDAAAQGRHFRQVAGDAGCLNTGALIPMLDMEDATVRATANSAVTAFYNTVGAGALARYGMAVYGNLDWWTNVLRAADWGQPGLVGQIARYNNTPGNPGYSNSALGFQQYSDTGSVPGIPGAVDLDCTLGAWSVALLRLGANSTPLPAPTGAGVAPPDPGDTWTVRAGDTLSRIASAWGVTVSAVAAANGIPDPDKITVGQVIHRPGTAGAAHAPTAGTGEYVVKAGDTLSAIASVHATTTAVLVALNHIANPDRISIGEVLHLPASGPATPVGSVHAYTVLPGDTLGVIAARLHVPGGWPALAARNHLANPNQIRPGEILVY